MQRGIHERKNTMTEPIAEPTTSIPDELESETDRFIRIYHELGADWAYFVVQFLRGKRFAEVQPEELVKTQLYLRANDAERRALDFVCQVDFPMKPLPDDVVKLRIRDQFLIDYVDGLTLGHGDLVAEIKSIPLRVAAREQSDRALFAQVWESPKLFQWIWNR